MQRLTVHFTGNVQGVGFRYTTCRVAQGYDVRGFVRNLGDGSVELVAEGDTEVLDTFLEAVESAMSANIKDRKTSRSAGVGDFQDFRVAY